MPCIPGVSRLPWFDRLVTTMLQIPSVHELDAILDRLAGWQRHDAPLQLHPGDVGWLGVRGPIAVSAALRMWRRWEAIVAIGMLDGPVLRIALDPDHRSDAGLATTIAADLHDPARGALPSAGATVEAPTGAALHGALAALGWQPDEVWQPLRRDLADPLPPIATDLRLELVDGALVEERVAVHRASFDGSRLDADAWRTMVAGPAYADARCLLLRDEAGAAVAAATVWSAGPGRPGLVEPLGTHRDHRGRGAGTAISVAAASVLRDLGSSSADVCTPSSNLAAVATYRAAGFAALPERTDRRRPG